MSIEIPPRPSASATVPAPWTRLLAPAVLLAFVLLAIAFANARWPSESISWRVAASVASALCLWVAVRILDTLVWERLLPWKIGVRIPKLLRQVVAILFGVVVLTVVLGRVWQVAVGPVLAATGAVGIVIGLALRNVLADFFAGIALNMEQPFQLDDFVMFHVRTRKEPVAGFVKEINWRSTTVLTPEENLISVPNSVVAESTVENLSFPSPVYELELDLLLDWHLDPVVLAPVLNAALLDAWNRGATSGDKPPKFRIVRLDGSGVTYRIVYMIDPRRKPKGPARHLLLSCLQTHLKHAGLRPVLESQSLSGVHSPAQRAMDAARLEDRLIALSQVAVLGALTAEELRSLSSAVRVLHLQAAEEVVRQGDPGRSMFVVATGVLEVLQLVGTEGAQQRVAVLSPGEFLGEMSLLTEAPRTATVRALCASTLYEVPPEQMEALLVARPALADALGTIVAEHLKRDAAGSSVLQQRTPGKRGGLAEAIAAAMRRVFQA